MSKKYTSVLFSIIPIVLLVCTASVFAQRAALLKEQESYIAGTSAYCLGTHDIGRLVFGLTNFGMAGIGEGRGAVFDCFTGQRVVRGEYPKGTKTSYFFKGGIWVGPVVGKDTLVSTGADINSRSREFHPTAPMIHRSILDTDSPDFEEAVSEQDYIATYADTFIYGVPNPSFDPIDNRPHKPIGVEVTQKSYGWSYAHTDDFVIIEYTVRNISKNQIEDLYVGVYWDIDVHKGGTSVNTSPDPYGRKSNPGGLDDISGFIYATNINEGRCTFYDTLLLALTADNDGDAISNTEFEVPDITGLKLLGQYSPRIKLGYNWWIFNYNTTYDFGPQHKANFRNMGNGTGSPYGDRNKYHLLSNGEIDYDQIYAYSISQSDPVWILPTDRQKYIGRRGADGQFVLSVGPYDLAPGAVVTVPVAFVAGEGFHKNRYNHRDNLLNDYNPTGYYEGVDFSNLIANAATAGRVYDIPGVDTDEDGYAGKFHICILDSVYENGQWVPTAAETTYYEGDGFPDLLASAPPPSPFLWVEPIQEGIRVRWNGWRSENTKDVFSNKIDFEGYRVYIARDNRESSYSLVATYDLPNYDKYTLTSDNKGVLHFQIMDDPFTLEELRCLYGSLPDPCADSAFDPLIYSYHNPYVHPLFPDSIFYFTTHEYNQSELGVDTPIRKVYPNEPKPESLHNLTPEQLTEDGYPKYYEYECDITGLLPSLSYYIAVTAFDFGSPKAGFQALESSKSITALSVYPNNSWDEKPDKVENVYVYPNPYRQDGWYRQLGYEGRGEENRSRDRVRKVTFANLPPKCTISIFSLDGDLIREIEHNTDPSDPNSSYEEWDLVTRNVQRVASGLYYWVVEDDSGNTQIGKLVILL